MIFSHVANIKAKSTSTAFSRTVYFCSPFPSIVCFWGYCTGCLNLLFGLLFSQTATIFGRNDISKNEATIGDKIVETLYSNRVTTDNKRMHTHSPLPTLLHSNLWCLLFSRGSSNSSTTLHEGDGGVKALFPLLEVSKASETPFKAKCLN